VSVYLLLGDDEERKGRSVDKLRGDRTAEAFDAADASPEAVVSACNSYSLFGGGAFVLVRNLDAWNAAQKAVITAYLGDPSPETDLVLLGTKLGAREKLRAAVEKSGEIHTMDQPTGKALVKWAAGYAKRQDLDLPDDVAEDLASRCSGDKGRMVRELDKLALYVDGAATHEDVDALCAPDVQSNIFAFVDALGEGSGGRAVGLLEDLLAAGEPPLRLVFMVRRQFLLVARAQAMFESGASRNEVASELKVPPFVARKLEDQGRKLGGEKAEEALDLVLALESGLKGGSDLRDELQVEMTVMKLSEAPR
jgi:DNA polymerase III subunit delta